MKKWITIPVVAVILIIIGAVLFKLNDKDPIEGFLSYDNSKTYGDVIGTRTGTSTAGEFLGVKGAGKSATTTYVSKIAGADEANYFISFIDTSSTAAFYANVEGSYDSFCETSSSTPWSDPGMTDVVWVDASQHLVNRVFTPQSSTQMASSSVYMEYINPKIGSGQEIVLTNLNFNCLRLGVSGSSTVIYAGLSIK